MGKDGQQVPTEDSRGLGLSAPLFPPDARFCLWSGLCCSEQFPCHLLLNAVTMAQFKASAL